MKKNSVIILTLIRLFDYCLYKVMYMYTTRDISMTKYDTVLR